MEVSVEACLAASQNEQPFIEVIKDQTAAAWNLTPMGEASPISAEDVLNVEAVFSCGGAGSARRRRSLQSDDGSASSSSSASSISVFYTVSWRLSPGAMPADVTSNSEALQIQIKESYDTTTSNGASLLFAGYGDEIALGAVIDVQVQEITKPTTGGQAFPPAHPPSYPPTYLDGGDALRSESILAVPTEVMLYLNDGACSRARDEEQQLFTYMYRVATANSWNSSREGAKAGQGVFAADITGASMTFDCQQSSTSGVESGQSTISVTGTFTNVPLAVTAEIANGNKASYQAALVSYYRTGNDPSPGDASSPRRALLASSSTTDLASQYEVTSAIVTVQDAVSTAPAADDDDDGNGLALGLGLGLGLGIPVLACVVLLIVVIVRRRKSQTVSPAPDGDADDGEAAADEHDDK